MNYLDVSKGANQGTLLSENHTIFIEIIF